MDHFHQLRSPDCLPDADRYVGIPWVEFGRARDGCDCYGLLYLVYREELSCALPSYRGRYTGADDRSGVAALIAGEAAAQWMAIEAGHERVFDALLMREGRDRSHVGVIVRPGLVLHVERGRESVIEPYHRGVLRHRICGFYRNRLHFEK